MVFEAKNQSNGNGAETFEAPYTTPSFQSLNSADIFKGTDTAHARTAPKENETTSLELSNPFEKEQPLDQKAERSGELLAQAPADKPADKPLRKSELPDFKKFTTEEQEKVATDLAKQIGEKGFTPSPELRDKIREAMLRVYMDGDKDGAGNQKALDGFIKQMSDKLPKGMSLKVDTSETNKDFTAFRDKAQAAIDKQPGMKMGSCGQLQLCKTDNAGKTTVVDKMHYAASIRRPPTKGVNV